MLFNNEKAAWIMGGGEVDLPRDPNDWHNLAYRSIVWNAAAKVWQYITRAVEVPEIIIHGSYRCLADLIKETNRIHQIDDECTYVERAYRIPQDAHLLLGDRYIGTIGNHEIVVDRHEWELLKTTRKALNPILDRLLDICIKNESVDWDDADPSEEFAAIRQIIEKEIV
jgi:hypothetical protein